MKAIVSQSRLNTYTLPEQEKAENCQSDILTDGHLSSSV